MSISSHQKPSQKILPMISRFRESIINISLVGFAIWCFHRGSKVSPFHPIHWTTRIGQTVIFDAWVTGYTPVQMTIWEGDYLTRTQKQVLTNVRSMNTMRPQSFDAYGWVWFCEKKDLTNPPVPDSIMVRGAVFPPDRAR